MLYFPNRVSHFCHCQPGWRSSYLHLRSSKDGKVGLCAATPDLLGLLGFFPLLEHYFFWFLSVSCTGALTSGPTPRTTPPALFYEGFFQEKVLRSTCPGRLPIAILLVCASWVSRITDVSHWTQPFSASK
jgi:hypothetical protein